MNVMKIVMRPLVFLHYYVEQNTYKVGELFSKQRWDIESAHGVSCCSQKIIKHELDAVRNISNLIDSCLTATHHAADLIKDLLGYFALTNVVFFIGQIKSPGGD